jgi:hypothetical protein
MFSASAAAVLKKVAQHSELLAALPRRQLQAVQTAYDCVSCSTHADQQAAQKHQAPAKLIAAMR